MRKQVTHIENVPEKWASLNDYDSHRELLYLALINTSSRVIEEGMGFGSSPLISWECYNQKRHFEAFENNKEWWESVSIKASGDTTGTTYSKDILRATAEYLGSCENDNIGLLFIDCAPAELRKDFIRGYNVTANVILVHDTEEGAEYVYGLKEILSTFKYRLDYQPEGKPHTTAVSNSIDVTKWI